MPQPQVHFSEIFEGQDLTQLALLVGAEDSVLMQGDFTTWDLYVFEVRDGTPSTAIYTDLGNLPSAVIFDTVQKDNRWKAGGPGYNMRHVLTKADLAAFSPSVALEGGKTYRLEYIFHATAWGEVPAVFERTIVTLASQ